MMHCLRKLIFDSPLIKMNGFKNVVLFFKVLVCLLAQQTFRNWLCWKCFMHLKFRLYKHGMPCTIEINSNKGNEWACEHEWAWVSLPFNHQKRYISTAAIPMDTKFCRMVTYLEGLSHIKSHEPLNIWSFEMMWQTKTIISPLR